jgi:hypothetical protein
MSWRDQKQAASVAEPATETRSRRMQRPVPPLAPPATEYRLRQPIVVRSFDPAESRGQTRKPSAAGPHTRLIRARRVLVWTLATYVVIHVSFLLALSYWPTLGDPEYGSKLQKLQQHLQVAADRPQVILLGTSRSELDVRPDALPAGIAAGGPSPLVFNMALRGASPLVNLCCLQRLLDQGVRPDWLLIEILPPQLQGKDLEEGGALCLKHRLRWSDVSTLEGHSHAPWYRRMSVYRPLVDPWCEHARFVLGQYVPIIVDDEWLRKEGVFWRGQDDHGWVACPMTAPSPAEYRKATVRIQSNYGAPFTWNQVPASTDRVLRTMLQRCAAARIKVALVIMPESTEFRTWYSPATRRTIDDYLASLTREYDVPLIDASTWMGDDCFADCHHLRPAGAAAFSERFGREVLQPLLAGSRANSGESRAKSWAGSPRSALDP